MSKKIKILISVLILTVGTIAIGAVLDVQTNATGNNFFSAFELSEFKRCGGATNYQAGKCPAIVNITKETVLSSSSSSSSSSSISSSKPSAFGKEILPLVPKSSQSQSSSSKSAVSAASNSKATKGSCTID